MVGSSSESESDENPSASSSAGTSPPGDIMFGSGCVAASALMLRRRRVGRSGVDLDWMVSPMEEGRPLL